MYLPFIVLLISVKEYTLGNLGGLNWLSINNQINIFSIILIAVGVAMDSLAASITRGVICKQVRIRDAAKIALFFGICQMSMPVLGWLVGSSLSGFVSGIGFWIAFVLLSLVGGRMIYESFKKEKEEKEVNPLSVRVLLVLSIATSIDSFPVGASFGFLGTFILIPAIVIGTVTFLLTFIGVFVGCRLGLALKRKVEVAGGLILIGIGLEILIANLFFSMPF
jgi:putative Mn2+ efflux pump MntP